MTNTPDEIQAFLKLLDNTSFQDLTAHINSEPGWPNKEFSTPGWMVNTAIRNLELAIGPTWDLAADTWVHINFQLFYKPKYQAHAWSSGTINEQMMSFMSAFRQLGMAPGKDWRLEKKEADRIYFKVRVGAVKGTCWPDGGVAPPHPYRVSTRSVDCPDCGRLMTLRRGKFGKFYGCSFYPHCKGTQAASPDGSPIGTPANKATKRLRQEVHAVFDPLWEEGPAQKFTSRDDGYVWIQKALEMTADEAHIGNFDAATCRQLIGLIDVVFTNPPKVGYPDVCPTCKTPYEKYTASLCSNFFHCCRDCTWLLGKITSTCKEHTND